MFGSLEIHHAIAVSVIDKHFPTFKCKTIRVTSKGGELIEIDLFSDDLLTIKREPDIHHGAPTVAVERETEGITG